MIDYSLSLVALRKLSKEYENALLSRNPSKAYQISDELVEMALKLQDIANENQKI